MEQKSELHNEAEIVVMIYFRARQSFEIYKYIIKQNTEDPFWVQIMYLTIKDTILELDKLFSEKKKNHKFCIAKLIDKANKSRQLDSASSDNPSIIKWKNEIIKFYPFIEQISNLRDKHFAHTDKHDPTGLNTLTIDYRSIVDNNKIEELFDFLDRVIKEIYLKYIGGYYDTSLFFTADRINVFAKLKEYSILKNKQLAQRLNKQ